MFDRLEEFGALAADVRRLSFRHGIAVPRLLDMLASADRDAAQQGQTKPSPMVEQLVRLDRRLHFTGSAYWINRVRTSPGSEALFDQEFRFLAVSQAGRTITCANGKVTELPESALIGTRCADLLPGDESLLGDGHPGFDGLKPKGFFDGGMLGVQLNLDMNLGYYVQTCIMEIWAVQTFDRGILGHSLIHRIGGTTGAVGAPGVKVNSAVMS